jgi:hypothetical protein
MTTVEVEVRKFKPIEIRHLLIYKLVIISLVLISFAAMGTMEII